MADFLYPSVPKTFFYQRTPGRIRLFVGELGKLPAAIEPVTTVDVKSDTDVDQLINSLTTAAWTDDRTEWESIASHLPDPVVLACNQALANMPPSKFLAMGSDDIPMTVLHDSYAYSVAANDLVRTLSAAYDIGQQVLVENYRSDYDGEVACRVRLLSGETEIFEEEMDGLWPTEGNIQPTERLKIGPKQLQSVLEDPRWANCRVRGYWAWFISGTPEEVDEGNVQSTAQWVIEFFEEELLKDPVPDEPEEFERFVLGDWNPWPMTARTRFILWLALGDVLVALSLGLELWDEIEPIPKDDDFMRDFPHFVRDQPRAWWNSLRSSCERLVEAMRTGDHWNPRTPGEEALIYVASQPAWIEAAYDSFYNNPVLERQFENLPVGEDEPEVLEDDDEEFEPLDDFVWDEVPGALAGDEDIALCWSMRMDGINAPDAIINKIQGIGDYRAPSWHTAFDRYKDSFDFPSSLF